MITYADSQELHEAFGLIELMQKEGCAVQLNWGDRGLHGLVTGRETGEYYEDCAILETVSSKGGLEFPLLILAMYCDFEKWVKERDA